MNAGDHRPPRRAAALGCTPPALGHRRWPASRPQVLGGERRRRAPAADGSLVNAFARAGRWHGVHSRPPQASGDQGDAGSCDPNWGQSVSPPPQSSSTRSERGGVGRGFSSINPGIATGRNLTRHSGAASACSSCPDCCSCADPGRGSKAQHEQRKMMGQERRIPLCSDLNESLTALIVFVSFPRHATTEVPGRGRTARPPCAGPPGARHGTSPAWLPRPGVRRRSRPLAALDSDHATR